MSSIHGRASVRADGIRFDHVHTACLVGYYDLPAINSNMLFELRHLPRVISRLVRVGGRNYELWSCNSRQLPYFPGASHPDFRLSTPSVKTERRYDGHLGRYDCLYSPQYWRTDRAHWPFMRRVSHVRSDDYAYAAFVPLTEQWASSLPPHKPYSGQFDRKFVDALVALRSTLDRQMDEYRDLFRPDSRNWTKRPYVSESRILELLAIRSWDSAVACGVAIQRVLREADGWIAWNRARRTQAEWRIENLRRMEMPVAEEEFIGFWANGCSEEVVLRHLVAKVPCFVIHECLESALIPRGVPTYENFVDGTAIAELLSDSNPYQRLARLDRFRLDAVAFPDAGRADTTTMPLQSNSWSSSVHLRSLPLPTQSPPRPYSPARPPLVVAPPRPPSPVSTMVFPFLWASASASNRDSSRSVSSASAGNASLPRPASNVYSRTTASSTSGNRSSLSGLRSSSSGMSSSFPGSYRRTPVEAAAAGERTAVGPRPGSAAPLVPPAQRSLPTPGVPSRRAPAGAAATTERTILALDVRVGAPAVPEAPRATQDAYAARSLEFREIDPRHAPWIVPPPIHPGRSDKGHWAKFELSETEEGETAWMYRGQNFKPQTSYTLWDRELKRSLHADPDELPPKPPGLLDEDRFGMPAPRLPFFQDVHGTLKPFKASSWVYETMNPSLSDVGRRAELPDVSRLPLIPGSSTKLPNVRADLTAANLESMEVDSEPEQRKGKGKGKARAVAGEDEVSLGLSDSEGEEVDSMDVDAAPGEPHLRILDLPPGPTRTPPSNVVVLDNVGEGYDALMFRELARDALYRANARPLAILRARGRMWVRFATTTLGQRARSHLQDLHQEVSASYAGNEEFDDAARYSNDLWTEELERGLEGNTLPPAASSGEDSLTSQVQNQGERQGAAPRDLDEPLLPVLTRHVASAVEEATPRPLARASRTDHAVKAARSTSRVPTCTPPVQQPAGPPRGLPQLVATPPRTPVSPARRSAHRTNSAAPSLGNRLSDFPDPRLAPTEPRPRPLVSRLTSATPLSERLSAGTSMVPLSNRLTSERCLRGRISAPGAPLPGQGKKRRRGNPRRASRINRRGKRSGYSARMKELAMEEGVGYTDDDDNDDGNDDDGDDNDDEYEG